MEESKYLYHFKFQLSRQRNKEASKQERYNALKYITFETVAGNVKRYVCSFPKAAITNYYKLSELKQQKFISHTSGDQKS